MHKRCDRNRKRSQRRAIFCPIHGCHMHSVSQKHSLFVDRAEQLQQHGMGRRAALLSMTNKTTVSLKSEWLEAFWCDQCQETKWYHVRKSDHVYDLSTAPPELWQQAIGVVNPEGNPSVSEFTRRSSRMNGYTGFKGFNFLG